MRKAWLICVFVLLGIVSEAQMLIVPREKLSEVNNPRLSRYASSLRFDKTLIVAEKMNEDDGVFTFSFPFKNIGNEPLVVSRLVSTCSCQTASCAEGTIAPGDSSEIVVRYNPKGHPGRFERKVYVYMCDDESPSAILRLAVDVERGADLSGLYPVSMGNVRLRRSEAFVSGSSKSVERFVFVNVSDRPLELRCETAMLPPCLSFRTEPQIVGAGKEGEIVLVCDPSKGSVRDKMTVLLKGTGVPPSQSSIVVFIKKE